MPSDETAITVGTRLRGKALRHMTQALSVLLSRNIDSEMPHDEAMQLMRGLLGVIHSQQQLIGELIEIIEQQRGDA
jgi:hypothetical protein